MNTIQQNQNYLFDNGKPLHGISVGANKFQSAATLDMLEDYGLKRPSRLEAAKVKDLKCDARLSEAKSVRDQVQRLFDATRRKRAEVYSAYIEAVECGDQLGGTPAITIYLPTTVLVEPGRIVIPYNSTLIAIDGETQTEARFMLRDRRPSTGQNPIAITIYHGNGEHHAQQILHDYNRYVHPVSEKQIGTLNHTGPLPIAVNQCIENSGLDLSKINRFGKRPSKSQVVAYEQVASGVVGYVMGDQALRRAASRWFDELGKPTSDRVINGQCIPTVTSLVVTAMSSMDARSADPAVWQVAGVVAAKGKPVSTLNWSAAIAAYKAASRSRPADRYTSIAAAI